MRWSPQVSEVTRIADILFHPTQYIGFQLKTLLEKQQNEWLEIFMATGDVGMSLHGNIRTAKMKNKNERPWLITSTGSYDYSHVVLSGNHEEQTSLDTKLFMYHQIEQYQV